MAGTTMTYSALIFTLLTILTVASAAVYGWVIIEAFRK